MKGIDEASGLRRSRQQATCFEVDDLGSDLSQRTLRGTVSTGLGQFLRFGLKVMAIAALARLIEPEAFGLIAMTGAIQSFLMMLRDAGLSTATIQSSTITHEQVSMLFWINLALGLLAGLSLLAASPLIAAFFGEPRLLGVSCSLSATFVLGGLTVQHQALLRRRMRFVALATINTLGLASGAAIGVVMAYQGCGYWALVGMIVGEAAVVALGAWIALPWIPGLPRRGTPIRKLIGFGSDVLAFEFVNFFSRQADTILIGWYWGAGPLAFYDKAHQLLLMPIRQINAPLTAVAMPALSRARSSAGDFRLYFLNALRLVSAVSFPILVGIALFANEAVAFLLGPAWGESAVLFRLLCVSAMVGAISNPIGWLLLSLGYTKRCKRMGIATSFALVGSFCLGLPYGPQGVAIAYSSAMALLFIPVWSWALQGTGMRLREILSALFPAALASLSAAAMSLVCRRLLAMGSFELASSLWGVGVFAATYVMVLLLGFGQWRLLREMFDSMRGSGGPQARKGAIQTNL